jgi:hypothetical protein
MILREEFEECFRNLEVIFGEPKNHNQVMQIWYDIFKHKRIEAIRAGINQLIVSHKPMGSHKFPVPFPVPAQLFEVLSEVTKDIYRDAAPKHKTHNVDEQYAWLRKFNVPITVDSVKKYWDDDFELANDEDWKVLQKTIAGLCSMPKNCEDDDFHTKMKRVKSQKQLEIEDLNKNRVENDGVFF